MAQAKRKERSLSPVDDAAEASGESGEEEFEPWQKPAGLTRRGWMILGGFLLLVNVPILHMWLKGEPEVTVQLPYMDDFSSRETIKKNYFTTGGLWRVVDGQLFSPGVKNNPLWLKAKLPRDVVVEFDVRCDSPSPDTDIRVEIFGDGVNHLSGYELVHGAYGNSRSIIGRLDDRLNDENNHSLSMNELQNRARQVAAEDHLASAGVKETGVFRANTHVVLESNPYPVTPRKTYHWRIERRGSVLRWDIDGQPFMQFDDPFPLEGKGHDRFGPSSAESDVYFDNLRIEPLDGAHASQPFAPMPTTATAPTPMPAPAAPAPAPAQMSSPASSPAVPTGVAFADNFDRAALGSDWNATDATAAKIEGGVLSIQNAHNHPVWLTKPIPDDAQIDFDAWADTAVGDIKVEVWGDGQSFHNGPMNAAYTSTGYVFVFGGWNNTISAIAKQHEHGPERTIREDVKVEPGRHYHWRILRKGDQLAWYLDGKPFLGVKDPAPLTGTGHQYFAFGDWESPVHFDNLVIQPLG